MKHLRLTLLSALTVIWAVSSAAEANLLVDPGYEVNPLTNAGNVLNNFPAFQGVWGVESATITGVDGAVSPAQGTQMLRMTSDNLSWTQGFQATNVTSYAALIDSGSGIVNISALLNADPTLSGAIGNVSVLFFSTSLWSSQIGTPVSANLTLDNTAGTWELLSTSGAIPVNTRWLITQVAYQNASLLGADGVDRPGYVDATDLRIVPEPATLGLLMLGALTLRKKEDSRRYTCRS